jgi:CRP-like cAMP-binding protein
MESDKHFLANAIYVPPTFEDPSAGAQLLRRAFLAAPPLSANRGVVIVPSDAADPPSVLTNRGVAYRSLNLLDGRRAIADIILPTDIAGIDQSELGRCGYEIVAASLLGYRLLTAARVRELMRDPRIAARALTLAAAARQRADGHFCAVTKLDARGRMAWMMLDIYERLRRKGLISRPAFNLPLTQDQIADYLGINVVYVSRTLRRMREEGLLLADRHVVSIHDLKELRRVAAGSRLLDEAEPPKKR